MLTSEYEHTACGGCRRSTGLNGRIEVLDVASPPACDNGYLHSVGHRADEVGIVTRHRAVTVDIVEENFTRAFVFIPLGQLDGIETGVLAPSVGSCLISTKESRLGIDARNYTLTSKLASGGCQETGIPGGVSIDANLLHAQSEKRMEVRHAADSASICERHETFAADVAEQFQGRPFAQWRSSNVDENQLVDFLVVEDFHRVDWVADVFRVAESNRLDQTPVLEKKARDHSYRNHFSMG